MEQNKKQYDRLMRYIPKGGKNAILMRNLSAILGTDDRGTRQIVCNARIAGCLIAANDGGYFQPETLEELQTYYRTVCARQATTDAALAAVRKKIKEMGGTL